MDNFILRSAGTSDAAIVQQIARETFFDTFAAVNSTEDMQRYLDEELSLTKISEELSDSDTAFYLVFHEDKVIAYLKLNFGQSQKEIKETDTMEIERIYVLREFHGKNVAQLLLQKAIDRATQIYAKYIWLGVWEHNQRAIRFYSKNNFYPFGKHEFILGADIQTDVMMKLDLH